MKNLKFYFTVLDYIKGTDFMDLKSVPNYFREHFGLRKDEAVDIINRWQQIDKGEN
tara:strand:- start:4081 stop:4248 length:168 start_codon:yes stop_codon:yes gene_type:complete